MVTTLQSLGEDRNNARQLLLSIEYSVSLNPHVISYSHAIIALAAIVKIHIGRPKMARNEQVCAH